MQDQHLYQSRVIGVCGHCRLLLPSLRVPWVFLLSGVEKWLARQGFLGNVIFCHTPICQMTVHYSWFAIISSPYEPVCHTESGLKPYWFKGGVGWDR